jgi:hypothetical protein
MMNDQISECTLVVKPHPLKRDSFFSHVPAGQSVLEMLGGHESQVCEVRIGGQIVPR